MVRSDVDPHHFFDHYPRFLDTSATGPWLERLNARYVALVERNRSLIEGARVLDLASHDGRFSFAALDAGAAHVTGVELDELLRVRALENFAHYGVASDRYEFVRGDIFDKIAEVEPFDVVFCFGILYHITDHMQLLSQIAAREPRHVLIDTHVSQLEGAVVEIRNAMGQSPPPPGSYIEGHPTRAALEAMLTYFGWTFGYFDWSGSGLIDSDHMTDYRSGKRVSIAVDCGPGPVPVDVRDAAVRRVVEADDDRRTQWIAITEIAPEYGLTPQALRFWVRRAERLSPGSS